MRLTLANGGVLLRVICKSLDINHVQKLVYLPKGDMLQDSLQSFTQR